MPATIPVSEVGPLFTRALVAVYKQNMRPSGLLRSFFRTVEKGTRYLSIAVERGTEKVAVDVLRGTEGNRNRWDKTTTKTIDPPYYREYFDITELDLYDRLFSSDTIDSSVMAEFVDQVTEKMLALIYKIERAMELQCAQVLQTGIVTIADGSNIDFKRKAGSLVDGTATPWTGAYDPYAQLEEGATFLRTIGKTQGGVFNVLMGGQAAAALTGNAKVLARGPLTNINWDQLRGPQRDSVGGVTLGSIKSTNYLYNLWTYPEYYEDASGTNVPYLDPKKIIMLPENPNLIMGFAAVPQLINQNNPRIKTGAFVFGDYIDERAATHVHDVKSAPIAIPVAVDQIYTRQVVA